MTAVVGWLAKVGAAVGLAVAIVSSGGPGAHGATYTGPVDVRVQVGQPAVETPNLYPVQATVFSPNSNGYPMVGKAAAQFTVVASAATREGGQTYSFPCSQSSKKQPSFPPNVYACNATLAARATWTITTKVFPAGTPVGAQSQALGSGSATVRTGTGDSAIARLYRSPTSRSQDWTWLALHTFGSFVWLFAVAALAFLAVPNWRRMLSDQLRASLRTNFAVLETTGLISALLTTGTGIYLLVTETPVRTPLSSSDWHAVAHIPDAVLYFVTLVIKILAYLAMEAATIVLLLEARRQVRMTDGSPDLSDGDFDPTEFDDEFDPDNADAHLDWAEGPPAGGGAAVLTRLSLRRRTAAPATGSRFLKLAVATEVGAGFVVLMCVVFVKYFHELVEAARAIVNHAT